MGYAGRMYLPRVAITWLLTLAACDGGVSDGDELACLGGPGVVMELLAPDSGALLAIDFNGMRPFLYEEVAQVWRPLGGPQGGPIWAIGLDGSYLTLQMDGLYRSLDAETWETLGPGSAFAGVGTQGAQSIMGPTSDGSYWTYFGNAAPSADPLIPGGGLNRLLPGAQQWAPAFTTMATWVRKAGMGRDGTIWLVDHDPMSGAFRGLLRITADGSSVEPVFDCTSAELLYCVADVNAITFNAEGDLFYYLRNDLQGIHRFFEIAAGTKTAVERGRLPVPLVDFRYGTSIAAIGKTLYITARDGYTEGGRGYLVALGPGDTEAHQIVELLNDNSEVVTSRDHVYAHSPGICRLE